MPIYYYWGDDEFAIASAVQKLRDRTVDPNWASFNYTQHSDTADGATEALNQAMTPPFGSGSRLIWLVNTTIGQQCPEEDQVHDFLKVDATSRPMFIVLGSDIWSLEYNVLNR